VSTGNIVPVVLLHAPEEAAEAQTLAQSIGEFGYVVWHTGQVLVGDVVVKELSERLALGGPVVICGTARAAGSKWLRKVVAHVQAVNTNGRPRIFPVRMDSDADLEAVGLSAKIAECSVDRRSGLDELRKALAHHFPANGSADDEPARTGSDLPTGDFDSWLTRVVEYSNVAVRSFRERLRPDIREFQLPDTLDADTFLAKANLAVNRRLYGAGVLLFSAAPATTVGSAYIQCVHYSGPDRTAGQDGREFVGPIMTQLLDAMTFIENRIDKTDTIPLGSVAAQPEFQFPMVCLRELLANALCHRDYLESKRHTHVRIFQDKIEIVSPGRWAARSIPERLDLQLADLMSEPVARNERLSSALRWVRLVETQGSGIPNALIDCAERGAPPPTVMFADEMVKVTIFPRRDWDTATIGRRGVQLEASANSRNVITAPKTAPAHDLIQCEVCYSEVPHNDRCAVCLAPLPTNAVARPSRVESTAPIGEDPDQRPSEEAARRTLSMLPAAIHYARALSGHDYYETVRIENRGMVGVEIIGIESNQPWLSVLANSIPFILGASETYTFAVVCRPHSLTSGAHRGAVTVHTRDRAAVTIGVVVDVIQPRPYPDYVGIDFGTTNSVVAVLNPQTHRVELVQDELSGSHLIPSVLVFEDAYTYKIGQAARNEADIASERTVRSIKRILGHSHERQFFDRVFSASELASLIIRKLIQLAEKKLYRDTGTYYSIQRAIITVPANFFDLQICGVLDACRAAGLDIEEESARRAVRAAQARLGEATNAGVILDEPAAAVLYYIDFLRQHENSAEIFSAIDSNDGLRLLVFDYGGGTLDVSTAVVSRAGGSLAIRILANVGDNSIGGDVIDLILMNDLLRRCVGRSEHLAFDSALIALSYKELAERKERDHWTSAVWMEILRARSRWKDLAEAVKVELGRQEQVEIEIPSAMVLRIVDGSTRFATEPVKVGSMDQSTLRNLLQPVLGKCSTLVATVLNLANLRDSDIDYILHTGRQSLLPTVREHVRGLFPSVKPSCDLLEEEHLKVCVAKGAALYGSMRDRLMSPDARVYLMDEGRSLPHSYGVETFEEAFVPKYDVIIPRGSKYPIQVMRHYGREMVPDSGQLNLRFYQNIGMRSSIIGNSEVKFLGEIMIDADADGQPGCDVRFVVGANRTLEVFADDMPVVVQRANLQDEDAWWR